MKWLIIGILCVCGVAGLMWVIGKWVDKKFTFNPPAPTPTATSTSPTPPPTPAPAHATSKSYGWVWSFVLVFFGGLIALAIYHKVLVPSFNFPASPPQATAPQRQLQQRVVKRELQFVGGEGAIKKEGLVDIRNGGHAAFTTWDLPWKKDAIYHVVFYVLRKNTTGYDYIEINGRSGDIFCKHYASDKFETVVFFERDMSGDSKYFNPGINQIKFWSPGDNIIVQSARIEMAYWE